MPEDGTRSQEIVAAGYDALAGRYRDWAAATARDPRNEWLGQFAALLPAGGSILDLGCGPGTTANRLAARFDVLGIDISERQIALARQAVPQGRFVVADMTSVDLPPQGFSGVVALFSLIHLPLRDLGPMLTRIVDWLQPGGVLLATLGTTDFEGVQDDWLGVPMYFSGTTPDRNRELLREAGFELLRDQVITITEPGEGDASFHWLLARRLDVMAAAASADTMASSCL